MPDDKREERQQQKPMMPQFLKTVMAATAGGSMLLMSGMILAGTVLSLTAATPLLVIFSPVLVPATIAVALIGCGFLVSGGFGLAALTVVLWVYKHFTVKHPAGADQVDKGGAMLAAKGGDIKE
ncbi:hypothetical protein HPP92_027077 [Vanilla planifolia]|uniref:Oleosin n=1 Tax=Vanilla planifolia TaxID=51239 RepID=A0A835U6N8_VANPL|nr:hypothetical protein HPP92_027077 [Vanilla planifolia]